MTIRIDKISNAERAILRQVARGMALNEREIFMEAWNEDERDSAEYIKRTAEATPVEIKEEVPANE